MIYQILGAYFEDDCADELTIDPVLTAILSKKALASQPTLSRFFNRMDETTLNQFYSLMRSFRKVVYSIKRPEMILLDVDSTLLDTYGKQESEDFNYHYQSHGYHPLVCYDGITGDLLKIQLRDGADYSSTGVEEFMQPLLDEFQEDYPDIPLLLRGDRGFTKPEFYEQCESNGVSYVIRLKASKPCSGTCIGIQHFNWFKRLVLPAKMRKQLVDTIRLKLLKVAAVLIKPSSMKHWTT